MENMLKYQKKISFSGGGALHQDGTEEQTIKMIFNVARTMLMHADLRCPKDTLSTDFSQ